MIKNRCQDCKKYFFDMMNQKPYCTMKKEIIIFNFHGEDITIPEWCPLGESVKQEHGDNG